MFPRGIVLVCLICVVNAIYNVCDFPREIIAIYNDSISSSWQDWHTGSYGSAWNFSDSRSLCGSHALYAKQDSYSSVWFHANNAVQLPQTTSIRHIQFYIKKLSNTNVTLNLAIRIDSGSTGAQVAIQSSNIENGTIDANWRRVRVPLSSWGSPRSITDVLIIGTQGSGTVNEYLYDNIWLVADEPTCQIPGSPPNGRLGSCDNRVGGDCYVTCNVNYTLSSNYAVTCMSSVSWNSSFPTCDGEARCGNGLVEDGEECDDEDGCCTIGCTFRAAGVRCWNDQNDCTQDVCTAKGVCVHQPLNGTLCDDHVFCTTTDTCFEGVCIGTDTCINMTNNADFEVPYYNSTTFRNGINMGCCVAGYANPELAAIAAQAGVNSNRVSFPEPFFTQWGIDIDVNNQNTYASLGLEQLTAFISEMNPDHATGTGPHYAPTNLYEPIWNDSSNSYPNPVNYWASFFHQVVSKYNPWVKIYEIWNEPDWCENCYEDTISTWCTDPILAASLPRFNADIFAYIRMLRIAYEVGKSINPDIMIATGGLGYECFLDAILRYTDDPINGSITPDFPHLGGAYFDVLSFHYYPIYQAKSDSDSWANGFIRTKQGMEKRLMDHGYDNVIKPKKIFICTETGAPDEAIGGRYGSDAIRRNYLLKMLVMARANDIKQVHWFDLYDPTTPTSAYDVMGHYGDLTNTTSATAKNVLKSSTIGQQTYASLGLYNYYYAETESQRLQNELGTKAIGYVLTNQLNSKYFYIVWANASVNNDSVTAELVDVSFTTISDVIRYDWDYHTTQITTFIPRNLLSSRVSVLLSPAPSFFLADSLLGFGRPIVIPSSSLSSSVTSSSSFSLSSFSSSSSSSSTGGGDPKTNGSELGVAPSLVFLVLSFLLPVVWGV